MVEKFQFKEKAALWLVGSLFSISIGLGGAVYASVLRDIEKKADLDVVTYLIQQNCEMQKDIKTILSRLPR